ncbi:MAG: hypothetical protein ACOCUO_02165 [archaeon]
MSKATDPAEVVIPDPDAEDAPEWRAAHIPGRCRADATAGGTITVTPAEAERRGYDRCVRCQGRAENPQIVRERIRELQNGDTEASGTDGATVREIVDGIPLSRSTVERHCSSQDAIKKEWGIGENGAVPCYVLDESEQAADSGYSGHAAERGTVGGERR